jgi:hypothetical protein
MAIKQCRYMSLKYNLPRVWTRHNTVTCIRVTTNQQGALCREALCFVLHWPPDCVRVIRPKNASFVVAYAQLHLAAVTDPGAFMQPEPLPTFIPQLSQRFQSLVWSCIDSDLVKTAVFHAERYYSLDKTNHDARHLYATALLRAQQTYSALHLVSGPRDEQCTGCLEIKAKCCTVLGRYRQAREALDTTLFDPTYVSSSTSLYCLVPLRLTYSSPSLHRIIDQSGGERLSRGCSNSM